VEFCDSIGNVTSPRKGELILFYTFLHLTLSFPSLYLSHGHFPSLLFVLMEPSTTDEPAKSHGNHTNKHHSLQSQIHDHHHGIGTLSSTSILIIIVSSISVVVVLTIFLIIAMLRRYKYSKDGGNCRDFSSCNTSKFISHTTIRFTPSPGNCPMSNFL